MCKCTPEIRTPFCGRGDCLPPGFANERIDGWKREFQKVQAKRDAYRERAEQAEARVAELTAQVEEFRKQLRNPRWCSIGSIDNVAEIRMHRAMWEKLTGWAAMEGQR